MDKVFNLEIDGQITLPDGVNYQNIVPESYANTMGLYILTDDVDIEIESYEDETSWMTVSSVEDGTLIDTTVNTDDNGEAWFDGYAYFIERERYDITIDGVKYSKVPTWYNEATGTWSIGSMDFDSYPFMTDGIYITFPEEGEHTVKIEGRGWVPQVGQHQLTIYGVAEHPIDGKYLPISEASDLHITRVGDRKVLTPFGAGYVPYAVYDEYIYIEAQMDGETTWGDSIYNANLVPGEAYEVSVNGVTNTYICQAEGDCYYIGTPYSKMDSDPSIGDWQIMSFADELHCNVCGYEGDIFEFEFSGMLVERSLIPSDWVELPELPAVKKDIYFVLDFEEGIYQVSSDLTTESSISGFNSLCKNFLRNGVTDWRSYKDFIQGYNIYGIVISRETDAIVTSVVPLSCNFRKQHDSNAGFCGAVSIIYNHVHYVDHVSFSYDPWSKIVVGATLIRG